MNILNINNLTFRYKNKFIYDKFNLTLNKGEWVTIAGPNGSGKTTLAKLILGLLKSYGSIKIFDTQLTKKTLYNIRKEIGYVFDNPDDFFACETVRDELAFSLENLGVYPKTINKKINEISKLLDLESLLDENPLDLSGGEKQKVFLGCALMLEPRILILDDALLMIDVNERTKLLKVIKEYNKKKRVTIISFTHNLDEALYSDRLVVLNDGKIIVDGKFPFVFKEEALMRKIGLEVPFMLEFSKKLNVYNLLDYIELDPERLVDLLWK